MSYQLYLFQDSGTWHGARAADFKRTCVSRSNGSQYSASSWPIRSVQSTVAWGKIPTMPTMETWRAA